MNEIERHLKKLFREIPESKRKNELMQEITQNLNEKVSDLIANGQTNDQAVKKVIDDFGDIDELKKEFEGSTRLAKSKGTGLSLAFSVWGAILITALVLFINFYYTPSVIWFVYPVFAVIWWPMSMFFRWWHIKNDRPIGLAYSICGFILIIGLLTFVNLYYTPTVIWVVYPAFAVIWWPLAMLFHTLRVRNRRDDGTDDGNE
jgi:hypothetical protein